MIWKESTSKKNSHPPGELIGLPVVGHDGVSGRGSSEGWIGGKITGPGPSRGPIGVPYGKECITPERAAIHIR